MTRANTSTSEPAPAFVRRGVRERVLPRASTVLDWTLNRRGERRAISRRVVFDALKTVTPSVAVDTDGLRVYVSTTDNRVSRELFATGTHERHLFDRVMSELASAGIAHRLDGRGFLDIGAHIGTATCIALHNYEATQVWAFEPAQENLQLLRQNLLVNGFEHLVSVHGCALSDRAGSASFELSASNSGDHRVRVLDREAIPSQMGEAQRTTVEVPTQRLDDLVEEGSVDLPSVGLAWIDVQGHEGQVLTGATALLRSDVPVVCEYWPYGLTRADGLECFHALVEQARPAFIDLRGPADVIRPASALRGLQGRFVGSAHTELLLLPARWSAPSGR